MDATTVAAGFDRGEFFLEYLPTMAVGSGRCVGGEALTRWRRPSGEILHPFGLLDPVDDAPLYGFFTCWVIETVAAELRQWLIVNPTAHVSINVPPWTIGRGGILYAIVRSRLIDVVDQIVFELTEHGVPDSIGLACLGRAAKHGIRLALDDASFGDANLMALTRVGVEWVKLAHGFAERLAREDNSEWQRVRAQAEATPIAIVAEYVETAEEYAAIRRAGVTLAQGFYFSRSLPARKFRRFYAARQQ